MISDTLYLTGSVGAYEVTHGELFFCTVLLVLRDRQYDLVTTSPGNRQVKHDATLGKLFFNSSNPFNDGETIQVLYRR